MKHDLGEMFMAWLFLLMVGFVVRWWLGFEGAVIGGIAAVMVLIFEVGSAVVAERRARER